jgi:thiamine-monophosphate kinase
VRVSDIGEFALIDRLERVLGGALPLDRVILGIGDDAAAWHPTPGTITVATADALVEGVHFDLNTTSWVDLGWKALAENISDIAAMGCRPRYGLLAIGLLPGALASDAEALYEGVAQCAEAYECRVVGGDVVRASCVLLQVTLIGESLPIETDREQRPLLERSRARPGDVLAVTGPLGGSAGGLRLLTSGRTAGQGQPSALSHQPSGAGTSEEAILVRAHRRPQPRVQAGLVMIEAGIRCAIDVSDGLIADVGHICERSRVDAEIDASRVPIFPEALLCFGDESLDLALSGGEDYELVCAAPEATIARASERLVAQGSPPLVPFGRVVEQGGAAPSVRVRGRGGDIRPIEVGGYQHFQS